MIDYELEPDPWLEWYENPKRNRKRSKTVQRLDRKWAESRKNRAISEFSSDVEYIHRVIGEDWRKEWQRKKEAFNLRDEDCLLYFLDSCLRNE